MLSTICQHTRWDSIWLPSSRSGSLQGEGVVGRYTREQKFTYSETAMNFESKYLSIWGYWDNVRHMIRQWNDNFFSFWASWKIAKHIFLKIIGLVHKSMGGIEKGKDTSQKVMLVFRPRTLTNTDFQRKKRHGHESGKLYGSWKNSLFSF